MDSEELKNTTVEHVDAVTTEENTGAQSEETQEPEKKYTDKDVDRIVAKKIASERRRMQRLFEEEQQVSEIEQRERNVLLRELKADAKDLLTEKGLPASLAELLDYSDKDAVDRSLQEVGEIFRSAVERGVKDRLRGNTPRVSYGRGNGDALRDAFRT